ncbi:protein translocase subunit SecF [Stella sp.]|jgi:preprotein translocase subunit SecF|uniref:protein translocase subunit SecF n=1 Tax=Stella sp. TaxID=2912054 RepID=UPI0035B287EB
MFKPIRLVKKVPNLDFFRFHKLCFALSTFLCLGSIASLATVGLNFGVDFAGGILIEVRSQGPANLAEMRDRIGGLNLGDVALQEFGASNDVLIRIERQDGGERAEMAAVGAVREALGTGYEYRRVEVVGPKVGAELVTGGILAVVLSLAGIMAYMALRFGWRAGLAGVVAILHDCLTTVGFFSITQLQFDLNVLAAVVTIAGFSINDTVVIDDRIRENLRKYKAMPFRQLINRSVNETMARTVVTNGLVFLAVFSLLVLGGPVLFGFAVAMTWGVVLGTYSTIYVAAPLEWYLAGKDTHRSHPDDEAPAAARP